MWQVVRILTLLVKAVLRNKVTSSAEYSGNLAPFNNHQAANATDNLPKRSAHCN